MTHRIRELPVELDYVRLDLTTSGFIFIQKWIQDQGGIWQCVIEPSQAGNIKTYHMSHTV